MSVYSPEIFTAARALCGKINQADLAKGSGVSFQAIKFMESGASVPDRDTVAKLEAFYRRHNIFLESNGVYKKDTYIDYIEGSQSVYKVFDYVESDLAANDSIELLIMFADESLCPKELIDRVQELRLKGLKMRHLIKDGDTHMMAGLDEYRYLPEEGFIGDVIYIFGDKVVQSAYSEDKMAHVLTHNKRMADAQRQIFKLLWDNAKPVKQSTSPVRFSDAV